MFLLSAVNGNDIMTGRISWSRLAFDDELNCERWKCALLDGNVGEKGKSSGSWQIRSVGLG